MILLTLIPWIHEVPLRSLQLSDQFTEQKKQSNKSYNIKMGLTYFVEKEKCVLTQKMKITFIVVMSTNALTPNLLPLSNWPSLLKTQLELKSCKLLSLVIP